MSKGKRLVEEQIKIVDYSFYGTREELEERLDIAFSKIPKDKHKEAIIELSSEHDYDDSTRLVATLTYKRLETDKEYEARLDAENRRKEYRRKQYEDLKKEFDK